MNQERPAWMNCPRCPEFFPDTPVEIRERPGGYCRRCRQQYQRNRYASNPEIQAKARMYANAYNANQRDLKIQQAAEMVVQRQREQLTAEYDRKWPEDKINPWGIYTAFMTKEQHTKWLAWIKAGKPDDWTDL